MPSEPVAESCTGRGVVVLAMGSARWERAGWAWGPLPQSPQCPGPQPARLVSVPSRKGALFPFIIGLTAELVAMTSVILFRVPWT